MQDVGIDKRGINMEEEIVMIINKMVDYLNILQTKNLQEVSLQTFSENTIQKEEIGMRVIDGRNSKLVFDYGAAYNSRYMRISERISRVFGKVRLYG